MKRERLLAGGRFATDRGGYAAMVKYVRTCPDGPGPSGALTVPAGRWLGGCWPMASRWWSAGQAGRSGLAVRHVVGGTHVPGPHRRQHRCGLPRGQIPLRLSRKQFRRQCRQPVDGLDAMVAVRTKGLRVLQVDGELEAPRMLGDRREAVSRRRGRARRRVALDRLEVSDSSWCSVVRPDRRQNPCCRPIRVRRGRVASTRRR